MISLKTLSIVVPCYNEEESLPLFYDEIVKIAQQMHELYEVEFELIFIDDGSTDNTLSVIRTLSSKDNRIHYKSFSRNFGKEAGIFAGLKAATGDLVAMMDADLQDPPELLKQMYEGIVTEDFDCVATRRCDRKGEPPIRSFFARCFYRLINRISKAQLVDGARDYRLMTRQMVNAIISLEEYNRFSKGIFSWVGFKTKWLEYENVERVVGETKWSFWKLFLYSLDGIFAFSTVPLAISSIMGILFCFIALFMAVIYGVKALIWGDPVAGFPTLICVVLLVGGIQLFCIGILGQYLSRSYLEIKKRPVYIVKEES